MHDAGEANLDSICSPCPNGNPRCDGIVTMSNDGCLNEYYARSDAYWGDYRTNVYTWSRCPTHVFDWWNSVECTSAVAGVNPGEYYAHYEWWCNTGTTLATPDPRC